MASKRRNMFQKNKMQETTENGDDILPLFAAGAPPSQVYRSPALEHTECKAERRVASARPHCARASTRGDHLCVPFIGHGRVVGICGARYSVGEYSSHFARLEQKRNALATNGVARWAVTSVQCVLSPADRFSLSRPQSIVRPEYPSNTIAIAQPTGTEKRDTLNDENVVRSARAFCLPYRGWKIPDAATGWYNFSD
ncbi:hypothetical protein AAG570_011605 [Ranatra chinensis]|uniref:Uncharacterized protein n=1 Tax=Ranatra chinensis TaxID=642074 RepID=A0ABD0YLD1_9HEMI